LPRHLPCLRSETNGSLSQTRTRHADIPGEVRPLSRNGYERSTSLARSSVLSPSSDTRSCSLARRARG